MTRTQISILACAFTGLLFSSCEKEEADRADRMKILLEQFINQEASNVAHPTGPDRANFRDFLMTVDIDKGIVPAAKAREIRTTLANDRTENRFNWKQFPSDVPGRVRAFTPTPDGVLWAGSVTGGLWKNPDFRTNSSWEEVESFGGVSIGCITYDPQDPQIMYVGTGESQTAFLNYRESSSQGFGIYRSADGGDTWQLLEQTRSFSYVNDIKVRVEAEKSVLYAGVASGLYLDTPLPSQPTDGLFRSDDNGETWEQVLPDIPGSSVPYAVSDLELSASNRLFVGTMRNLENKGGGVLLYSDDGTTWMAYSDYASKVEGMSSPDFELYPGRVLIKSAPSDPDVTYGLFMFGFANVYGQLRDYSVSLRKSNDGGMSWEELYAPGFASIPWHAAALAVDPNNPDKVLIGGLDVYSINDTKKEDINDFEWIRLSDWSAMYAFNDILGLPEEQLDSLKKHYVHADIHDIQFIDSSSDEVLIASDGGLFHSPNMTATNGYDPVEGLDEANYPEFRTLSKDFISTQYYTVALHPESGVNHAIGGTQDNGTIYNRLSGSGISDMISGGDGAYAFWDEDTPELYISSTYTNYYYVHYDGQTHFTGLRSGTFVNPAVYDSKTNLLYANMASGPVGGLSQALYERYYDSLLVINANRFSGTPYLGLDTVSVVSLNGGITEPFSAMKLSPFGKSGAEIIAGTHLGKVYRLSGLPSDPVVSQIDNGQIPVGYVSSVSIGRDKDHIIVTLSNYGVESIWITEDGGDTWVSLERNLPDMPVRQALFNPFDPEEVFIATETGLWILDDYTDSGSEWVNDPSFPKIRVDMMDVRSSDGNIAVATHGKGLFLGNIERPENVLGLGPEEVALKIFPNPVKSHLNFELAADGRPAAFRLLDLNGKVLLTGNSNETSIDVSHFPPGIYVLKVQDESGGTISGRVIKY